MGIPHLITYLQPYAVHKPLAGQGVVVDGPGLAYHIHHLCLSVRTAATNPFEAAPSYAELVVTVLAWLDRLEDSGAVVKKIYFDGFLPPSKFKTRSERMALYTKKLMDYHRDHSDVPYRASSRKSDDPNQFLFAGRPVRPHSTKLPAVPFLVPAILEGLLDSEKYKDITEVVPGEADLYCARYLKVNGGIVFTGDSDLLVHDLGLEGAVTFFKDIEVNYDDATGLRALYTRVYCPNSITDRLSLAKSYGMKALAFEIILDPHASFRNLLQDAKNLKAIKGYETMYQEFAKEYISLNTESIYLNEEFVDFQFLLKCLHPRTSESVLQFPYLAQMAGQPIKATSLASVTEHSTVTNRSEGLEKQGEREIHVFLSFLLDCPVRTNAWEMSTSVRQLAYGLLNLIVPEDQRVFTIYEHRRQQKESVGRALQLPQVSELRDACMAVVNLLAQLQGKLPSISGIDRWTAVAVYQDIEFAAAHDKLALVQILVCSDVNSQKKLSWDLIHFLAQLQGSYYSFRMLSQITSLVASYKESIHSEAVPEYVHCLIDKLLLLPPLKNIQEIDQITSVIHNISTTGMVEATQDLLGISYPNPLDAGEHMDTSKKLKKKRKRDQVAAEQSNIRSRSNNPFDLLCIE